MKLAPLEAERALLGALIDRPGVAGDTLALVGPDDFADERHRRLFDLIAAMWRRQEPHDLPTVTAEVRCLGAEAFGGVPYVANLVREVPEALQLKAWTAKIRDMASRRRLAEIGRSLTGMAADPSAGSPEVIAAAIAGELHRVEGEPERHVMTAGEAFDELLDHAEAAAKGGAPPLTTGIGALDAMLGGGFQAGQVVVVAARPGVGKTALSLQLAERWAAEDIPGAFFSQEMDGRELLARVVQRHTKIPLTRLRNGDLSQADWDRLAMFRDYVDGLPLHIDQRGAQTTGQIRGQLRRWRQRGHDLRFAVIDYLQLMGSARAGRSGTKSDAIEDLANDVKAIARSFGLCVLLVSQLNRDSARESRPPRMSDLRGSGGIEQAGDAILLIHRDEQRGQIDLAKHRQGPTGTVEVLWAPESQQYVEPSGGLL